MKTFTQKLSILALLFCIVNIAIADRGLGKKIKNKTILNITANISTIRNSITFNLKSGLTYSGSLLSNINTVGSSISTQSIITYQKGNMTYIIPFKQKLVMVDVNQGYTGLKMIIRSH